MVKKIKRVTELSEEEQKAADEKATGDAAKAAAGIQDEFQAKGFELVEWVQEREGLVLGLIGAVIVGGLAFGVSRTYSTSQDQEASRALEQAFVILEAPVGEKAADAAEAKTNPSEKRYKDEAERLAAAKAAFQSAADAHKGRGAALIASLYQGHMALKAQDYDAAAAAYAAFLDAADKEDPLRFAGLSGWAAALEAKGDRKGAIAKWEELVNLPERLEEDAALFSLGRLYEEEGDHSRARASYERIKNDFSESPLKTKAEEALAKMPPPPATSPAPLNAEKKP